MGLIRKTGQIWAAFIVCATIGYWEMAPRQVDAGTLNAVGGACCTNVHPVNCGGNGSGTCNQSVNFCTYGGPNNVCRDVQGTGPGSRPCTNDAHCYNVIPQECDAS